MGRRGDLAIGSKGKDTRDGPAATDALPLTLFCYPRPLLKNGSKQFHNAEEH